MFKSGPSRWMKGKRPSSAQDHTFPRPTFRGQARSRGHEPCGSKRALAASADISLVGQDHLSRPLLFRRIPAQVPPSPPPIINTSHFTTTSTLGKIISTPIQELRNK